MSEIKIALVSSIGIGDGIMFLLMARNLEANGFKVCLYSSYMYQLREWLPGLEVKALPAADEYLREFARYDIVLMDSGIVVAGVYPAHPNEYIYTGLGRTDTQLICDHSQRLEQKLGAEKFERCRKIATAAGEVRAPEGRRDCPMFECVQLFCHDRLGLEKIVDSCGLVPPPELELEKQKHVKRIIIHPFSSNEVKNYPLHKFLKLAEKLRKDGFESVFIASPSEREKLLNAGAGDDQVPQFPDIGALAAFIYESRLLVANDSGVMNLAAALGIVLVMISRKGRKHRWRPSGQMCKNIVIEPFIRIKIGRKKRLWHHFITVSMLRRAVKKLLDEALLS